MNLDNSIISDVLFYLFNFVSHHLILNIYYFYLKHKKLINTLINYQYEKNYIKQKLKKLIKRWNEDLTLEKINYSKNETNFYNQFSYIEYSDHYYIDSLNVTNLSNTFYDTVFFPAIFNNKRVEINNYFHVIPMFDDSSICIKKLEFDKRFENIDVLLFPVHDHSGSAEINVIKINKGTNKIINLLNIEEEYTKVNKIIVPKDINLSKTARQIINTIKNQ